MNIKEKSLTNPEKKKKEEIVKAMKPTFKGNTSALYAIATDKAKRVAEEMGNATNQGGASFGNGSGEQVGTPKAFKNNKKMVIRKSFLKELIQTEIKKFKNIKN
jgi:hypothetical protein